MLNKNKSIPQCFECDSPATWVRNTQFAGDHYYCEKHAVLESDFGDIDWSRVKTGVKNSVANGVANGVQNVGTKNYYVVYKSYQVPWLEHFEVTAENKNDARMKFLEANIKHDYIIKVIT